MAEELKPEISEELYNEIVRAIRAYDLDKNLIYERPNSVEFIIDEKFKFDRDKFIGVMPWYNIFGGETTLFYPKEVFLREFKDQFGTKWYEVCKNIKLSENFLRDFKHEFMPQNLAIQQKLSESFIEDILINPDFINGLSIPWHQIIQYQKLSCAFLERNVDSFYKKSHWEFICTFQDLDPNFLKKNKEQIVWDSLYKNKFFQIRLLDLMVRQF